MSLATNVEIIATDGRGWDRNPMLLGVQNGVLDLETGQVRGGRPDDLITKAAPVAYDPEAECPRFEQFMKEIFAEHPELVPYMQRCLGYMLTGLTSEQIFWILWGSGANGKSTLVELFLQRIFGAFEYGWAMPFPAAGWSNAMSEYQKACLVGRRFVTASEVTGRGHLNEELIKSLTGGDLLNARHPYGRPFQFVPVAKFLLRVNHKPVIRDETHGMWRRVKLVPFTQQFSINTSLESTLAAEAAGVLAWTIRGCLEWQREGLCEPAIVQSVTDEYRAESDVLAGFLSDCCVIEPGAHVSGLALFTAYRSWCDRAYLPDEERLSQTSFGTRIKARFPDTGKRTVTYNGVGLRDGQGGVM
jgi:putative DNA primase/helicase